MTEFKPGDRVRYTGEDAVKGKWSDGNIGTVVGPWRSGGSFVKWDGSDGNCRHWNDSLELLAPFEYRGGSIMMADGRAAFDLRVLPRSEDEEDRELRDKFGKFVASALNARVFGEE